MIINLNVKIKKMKIFYKKNILHKEEKVVKKKYH